ncbi:MAG: 5'-methylthioadenosine/adenosylhomocysteine nucleosidase [Kofleriaceae bacterium]
MTTLGVVSAMDEELAAVVAAADVDQVVTIGPRRFHRVARGGHHAILVVSRIGKVAAATTATLLIERFGVDAIVMTGLAGAVASHLEVGDVVVAEALLHHDLDARPLFPRHEVPLLGRARLPTDPGLTARLAAAAAAFVAAVPAEVRALGVTAPRVHRGLVVSGDQFVASTDAVAALRAAVPEALAVEMEGAAVAQVAWEHGVPVAVARVVSDRADHAASVDFARFLASAPGPYARALVEAVW